MESVPLLSTMWAQCVLLCGALGHQAWRAELCTCRGLIPWGWGPLHPAQEGPAELGHPKALTWISYRGTKKMHCSWHWALRQGIPSCFCAWFHWAQLPWLAMGLASMKITEGKCSPFDRGPGCCPGAGKGGAGRGSLWKTKVLQGKCVPALPEGHPLQQSEMPCGKGTLTSAQTSAFTAVETAHRMPFLLFTLHLYHEKYPLIGMVVIYIFPNFFSNFLLWHIQLNEQGETCICLLVLLEIKHLCASAFEILWAMGFESEFRKYSELNIYV